MKFTWGEKDGTGDLLVLSINDYIKQWVFKRDYLNSNYTLNTSEKMGNSINNLYDIYPGASFTENYIPGTAEYSDMNWNTLKLVFEKHQNTYYLVAVINDSWTI